MKNVKNTNEARDLERSGGPILGPRSNTPNNKNNKPPPLSCVVINFTPKSSQGDGGLFTAPRHSRPASLKMDPDESSQTASMGPSNSSSFKLMPRKAGSILCTPSPFTPSGNQARGRKRRALSMSSSSPETSHKTSPGSSSHSSGSSAASPGGLPVFRFKDLSIQSPVSVKASSPTSAPMPGVGRARTSSFSLYSGSPIGSVNNRTASVSLSGSVGSHAAQRTPCSSAKSSPRQVPLTVLSRNNLQQVPGPSPLKTPLCGRPPFHHGAVRPSFGATPQTIHQTPSPFSTPRNHDGIPPFQGTPKTSVTASVAGGSPRISLSPRTPLPRVTLSPRTPLSIRSRNSHTPSSYGQGFASLAEDGISSTPHSKQSDTMSNMMDTLLKAFPAEAARKDEKPSTSTAHARFLGKNTTSSQSLEFSLDGSLAGIVSPNLRQGDFTPTLKSGATATRSNNNDAPSFFPLSEIHISSEHKTPLRSNSQMNKLSEDENPFCMGRSLLRGPSNTNVFNDLLRAEARAGVIDAETGSLSDSDDEEDFILASPLEVARSKQELNQRARQRRRCSFERPSSENRSLLSSAPSNSSLYGMDIVHEEGGTDHLSKSSTSYSSKLNNSSSSGSSLTRKEGEYGSSNSLRRRKSEHSLGSLGMSLEATSSAERDLITPPVTLQKPSSPPPLNLSVNKATMVG